MINTCPKVEFLMKVKPLHLCIFFSIYCVSCEPDKEVVSSDGTRSTRKLKTELSAAAQTGRNAHAQPPQEESMTATVARIAGMSAGAFDEYRLGYFDQFSQDPFTTGLKLRAIATELAKEHPILALDLTEGFQKYPQIRELAQELSRSLMNERFADLSAHIKSQGDSVPDGLIRLFSKSLAQTDEARRQDYYQLIETISPNQVVDQDGLSLRRRYMEPLILNDTIQDPAALARLLSPGKDALEMYAYIGRLVHAQHREEPRKGFEWIKTLELPATEHNDAVVQSIERLAQAEPAKMAELLNDPAFIKAAFKLKNSTNKADAVAEENRLYDTALAGFLEVTVGLSPDAVDESANSFSSEVLRQDFKKLAAGLRSVDTIPQ